MSRKWPLLTLIFSLSSSGALQANPLDSPGIVYIDGLPCNRACQSYMAWSRPSPAQHREAGEVNVLVLAEPKIERAVHTPRPRVARQPLPVPRPAPRAGMAALNATPSNARASYTKKVAAPKLAHQATRKATPPAAATVTPEQTVKKSVAAGQEPEPKLESADRVTQPASIAAVPPAETAKPEAATPPPATLEIAAVPPTEQPRPEIANSEIAKPETAEPETTKTRTAAMPGGDAASPSASRTIKQQVAEATGMAERVTAITLEREQASKAGDASDAETTASVSPANLDKLVALVLTRPEINSLSDLNNKIIAIGGKQSAASGSVSAALMAAGAAEVQFSEGKGEGNTGAIDRLISGEVTAAVLALASREAAERFPDIAGFRIFRVPLGQRARL